MRSTGCFGGEDKNDKDKEIGIFNMSGSILSNVNTTNLNDGIHRIVK